MTPLLAILGREVAAAAARFGWPVLAVGTAAAALSIWFGLSTLFGGPSALSQAIERAKRAEAAASAARHAAAIEREGAAIVDAALRRARSAEAEAGAARLAAARAEMLAADNATLAARALSGPAGDVVCFGPEAVRQLNK